ncbi:arsenate reductase ArsC [Candidatus Omnitrophota bacterium]
MKKKRVLFICSYNSCRSQMAEGMLRALCGERYEVYSAGTKQTGVNPYSIKVMSELGIDISKQRSKTIDEFLNQEFDYVVTVCDNAKKSCPLFPGKCEKIHWGLKDPGEAEGDDEKKLAVFRKIRGEIKENIIATFK